METIASCVDCCYPIGISKSREQISCPMCGIEQEAVSLTFPKWLLLATAIGFILAAGAADRKRISSNQHGTGRATGKVVTVPGGSKWRCIECGKELKPGEQAIKLGAKTYCAGCIRER